MSSGTRRGSTEYVLKSLFAGGVAGCAAKTLIAPLDRVKILFQTNNAHFAKYAGSMRGLWGATRDIWQHNGVRGLFQGHAATLLRIFPYAAIKFMAYEQYRGLLMPTRQHETVWRQFWAGSFAGITSVVFTYPTELVRVRMAYNIDSNRRRGILATCRDIVEESRAATARVEPRPALQWPASVSAFYRGFFMTVAGMIPYAGVSFCTHAALVDVCRARFPAITTMPLSEANASADSRTHAKAKRDGRAPLRVWAELLCGGLSGATAQTVSYPLEVIRRRLQVFGVQHPGSRPSALSVARDIWATRGLRGFFVGLSIGYIKVMPMAAVAFTVYDHMKWLLNM
ncbi:mitochondrial carrier domain-containing protein [Syncephalis pseudoplumigaleata]|uniref:Mitochondrial carrier domain-containing protein n=1 Tax=Syncephalis pseudoplumigaleata TaxID=1712513 RepID=A0A4P9YWJ2_9FUNG|nr:mitochondrial carrier domain-containing protein [Syncephalis pseudoplumigaleata]|eukprot:RKP23852.1 mitochondrial carrier domain-containing protein [Syncephalis pseudoplumigaleata]